MFSTLEMAPPDAILGLTEAFKKDDNPAKINLGVGVYKDAIGETPILEVVKAAEKHLIESESTKSYKPIPGDPDFARTVQALLFGDDSAILSEGRAVTAHTPGGTGALRVAADFLRQKLNETTVWVTDPTWANHPQIFDAAGLSTKKYRYFDAKNNGLDFSGMMRALADIPAGSVLLLHGCCHNPTGVDPTPAQWVELAGFIAEQKLMPLIDFAYQGFADGLDADAFGVRTICDRVPEAIICSSFSKNFGLYNERTGAITLVTDSQQRCEVVMSHVKKCIRANYSNPPAHGGNIVTTVLSDRQLRALWEDELAQMRDRINGMRDLFVETLQSKGAPIDCSFMRRQRGMFSMSGLTSEQAVALREKYSIYIVKSGRVNVAGMTQANMDALCEGITGVCG